MDVPRVRYEFGTRRVGSSPPIADAGPNQLGIAAGTVTLDGCGSTIRWAWPLTYQWTQISGPTVTLSGANTVQRDLHRGRRPDLRVPPDGPQHGQPAGRGDHHGFDRDAGRDPHRAVHARTRPASSPARPRP